METSLAYQASLDSLTPRTTLASRINHRPSCLLNPASPLLPKLPILPNSHPLSVLRGLCGNPIMQNKANFRRRRIVTSPCIKQICNQFNPNPQKKNKPNSNPIRPPGIRHRASNIRNSIVSTSYSSSFRAFVATTHSCKTKPVKPSLFLSFFAPLRLRGIKKCKTKPISK